MQTIRSRTFFGERSAAYKTIRQTDYITRHRIYNRLLEMLSNPRIRHRRSGKVLPFAIHPQTNLSNHAELEAEIFYFATHHAPDYEVVRDVPGALYFDLKQTGESDLIFTKRAVAVPNFILNALCCEALEKEFSRASILACNGFCLREGYFRLDLDETLVRRGFITPEIDEKIGLIGGLRVFRYSKDSRPFILRTRSNSYISGGLN